MDINRNKHSGAVSDIDSIHNYYEKLVITLLSQNQKHYGITIDEMPDIACIALNHLPPRYIRYDVDMAFYLSPDEYHEIEKKVESAVIKAIALAGRRTSPHSEE
jgi:competence protein ComFB